MRVKNKRVIENRVKEIIKLMGIKKEREREKMKEKEAEVEKKLTENRRNRKMM